MTEIKLTKRYPQSRTEDIVDAYMRGWNDALDAVQNGKFIINDDRKTEPTISKMEQVPHCIDCTHYGDYEVCKGCDDDYNKFKSYYEPKDEPQTCSVNGRPYDCGKCEYFRCTADEPQIQLTVRCLNCNNAKACKEKHWSGCIYEPIDDEPQMEDEILREQCRAFMGIVEQTERSE